MSAKTKRRRLDPELPLTPASCYRTSVNGRCQRCHTVADRLHSPIRSGGYFCGDCCPSCASTQASEAEGTTV